MDDITGAAGVSRRSLFRHFDSRDALVAAALELPPELAGFNRRRREIRQELTTVMARTAWRRAGGRTRCPTIVADAMALTISTFTIQSLLADYDIGVDRAVEFVATVVNAAINNQLRHEQQPARRHR